jgi:hypothetical protein
LNECAGTLATRGIFDTKRQNGTLQTVVPIGEDTDVTECIFSDDDVTFDEDETEAHVPTRTYVWIDQGRYLAIMLEPGSAACCGHIAKRPAESLLGPRTPGARQMTFVSDSETQPESDGIGRPIPERNASYTESVSIPQSKPSMIDYTAEDKRKVFGFACAPAETCMEPHHETCPAWWTDE